MRLPAKFAITMALMTIPAIGSAQSGGAADLSEIDREVARFTGASIGMPGGARTPVDRRMRLARCAAPVQLSPYGIRQDTVLVQCPGGWRIFVPLTRGQDAGARADLISRGDQVSIILEGRGFSITQAGEAMEAGGEGDWIRVKPPGTGDPIRAKVTSPGRVTIPLG
jgi:flagella basal body P-ring formation protein FlgA